ncbi:MAG TPA: efflux transporter outer membrane subunit [Steroidobacteraceae bacterium]|jgi:multidrug efflux system outer membrane protein|nr:efflux transporter outer membrane subunit [Steroidobacteraceae bacterium]
MIRRKIRSAASLLVLASSLTACAVGPNYERPHTEVAPVFADAGASLYSSQQAQAQFWKQFGDAALDSLVADALLANEDLRIAVGNLAQARALRRQSVYDLAPTVTAAGGHQTQQIPQVEVGFPYSSSYYDTSLDASWELDLFGRVRRELQASTADLQAEEANLRAVQVSVIAQVARTYFELRGEQARLEVARRNVVNQQEALRLTRAQLDAGRATELDTSRAQAQLSTTLSTIDPLQAEVSGSIHRLGVLTGREPDALQTLLSAPRDLPPLPRNIAVGDPEELLRRRPDIRVAERQLAASSARIGVAIGDLFPKVTFVGSFGFDAATLSGLGTAASRAYTIGPGISWAAFNLGRVRAQVGAQRAQNYTALAQYEQTVLRALEEIEDALVTHARTRDELMHAADAAQASATAARLARTRYEEGAVDFLEVLDAERTQLQAEDHLAQSRTDAVTSLVAVYTALGGSWEGAPFPRYTQAASR